MDKIKDKIDMVRQDTYEDVMEKLMSYHKCIIIRPTGYGKTWLLTDLIRQYRKVLYLYPSEIIAETVKDRYAATSDDIDEETVDTVNEFSGKSNVTLMTYAKLIRLSKEDFEAMDYDCVITDEAHRLGGGKTKYAMSRLMYYLGDADFIGATATPNRTDSFDVVSMFFSNVMTFPYTLHDGFEDGMFKKPNYCYCVADIETDLKEAALTAGEDLNNPLVKEVLKKKYIEMAKLFGMDNIIRTYCDKYVPDTSYMKFIVFFANRAQMSDKLNEVKGWFKSAYPGHTIESLEISSRSKQETENVKKLSGLKARPETIQLIACIDMLNMGYHVNNLTGILMYRATKSGIIYIQQLGRALSSGADGAAMVFDVVDNLHRLAVYNIAEADGKKISKRGKKNIRKNKAKVSVWKVDNGAVIDAEGCPAPFVVKDDGRICDLQGNETNLIVDPGTGMVVDDSTGEEWYMHAGDIDESCVNRIDLEGIEVEGRMATYREILAKAVAEPMSQRCRIAINIHFKKWCEYNGIPYPISDKEFRKLEAMGKDDFLKYYKKMIESNKLDYPLQDAKKLVSYGDDDDRKIPLIACATVKNVSIRAILDMLEAA